MTASRDLAQLLQDVTTRAIQEPASRNRPIALYAVNYEDLNWTEDVATTATTGPFYWLGNDAYRAAVMADSPKAYWPLNDTMPTGSVRDETTGRRNGSFSAGVVLGQQGPVVGYPYGAAFIAGTSGERIVIVDTTELNGSTAITLECWFNPSSSGHGNGPWLLGKDGSTTYGPGMYYGSGDNKVSFRASTDGQNAFTSTGINVGTWIHVVGTFDGTTGAMAQRIYVNGALAGWSTGSLGNFSTDFVIGGSTSINQDSLNGYIAQAAVYHTALSSDRILAHYEAAFTHSTRQPLSWSGSNYRQEILGEGPVGYWRFGEIRGNTAHDESTYKRHGTYSDARLAQTGVINSDPDKAVYFAGGAASYVVVGNTSTLNSQTQLTIEAWVNPDTLTDPSSFNHVLGKGVGSNYELYVKNIGNVSFVLRNGVATVVVESSSGTVSTGAWTHIVATFTDTGDRVGIYRNGTRIVDVATTQNLGTSTDDVYIASRAGSTLAWVGFLDEIALYNTTLSSDRILRHYQLGTSTQAGPQWRPAST